MMAAARCSSCPSRPPGLNGVYGRLRRHPNYRHYRRDRAPTKISNEFGTNLKARFCPGSDFYRRITAYGLARSLHRQGQLDTIIWKERKIVFVLKVRSHKLAASPRNHHLIRINNPPLLRLNVGKKKLPRKRPTKYSAVVGGSRGGTGRKGKNTSPEVQKTCPPGLRKGKKEGFLNRSREQKLRG